MFTYITNVNPMTFFGNDKRSKNWNRNCVS